MNNTNNLLMIVAILAVSIALVNLGITVNKIGNIRELTGYATDTGDVNITIVNQAVINFNSSNVNWGSGAVDLVPSYAELVTNGTVTNGNWTPVTFGLSLQNDGNTNITVDLQSDVDADDFIGGSSPSPEFQINVSNNETNSCAVAFTTWNNVYGDINATQTEACSNMGFDSAADLVNIGVRLVIPKNAQGVKGAVITATGTPV